jgi:hypothetical protein
MNLSFLDFDADYIKCFQKYYVEVNESVIL